MWCKCSTMANSITALINEIVTRSGEQQQCLELQQPQQPLQPQQHQQSQQDQHKDRRKKRRNRKSKAQRAKNNIYRQVTTNNNVRKSLKEALSKSIEPANKGFKILQKMGYKFGSGLGKNGNGIREPVGLKYKTDRRGLGAKWNRNSMLKQKVAKKNKQQNTNSRIAERKTEELRVNVENERSSEQHTVKCTPNQEQPPFFAQNVAEVELDDMQREQESERHPQTLQNTVTFDNFLHNMARNYWPDIMMLMQRLDAAEAAAPLHSDYEIVIACLDLGGIRIAPHIFDFIRAEIVSWIGKYQHQNYATPTFYDMTNNHTNIRIICENNYAFRCLEQCVSEISHNRLISSILINRLPRFARAIYCYGVVYADIIRVAALFLVQIRLHKPILHSDGWIVVSHEICTNRRETRFVMLIDEQSALTLTYHLNNKLFICLQQAVFTNLGEIPTQF